MPLEAVPGPLWLSGQLGPTSFPGPQVHRHSLLSRRCLLDIHVDRQLWKQVRLEELTENIDCVLFHSSSSSTGQLI